MFKERILVKMKFLRNFVWYLYLYVLYAQEL